MNHASFVRGLQRVRYLRYNLEPSLERHLVEASLLVAPTGQILALDVFLFDMIGRLVEINIVKLDNVRMLADSLLEQPEQRHFALQRAHAIRAKAEFENPMFLKRFMPR